MRCSRCGKCCQKTEMMLCEQDVQRLEKAGYSRASFSYRDREGFARLRNRRGHCVFYLNHRCSIYKVRPTGCRVYPLMLSEGDGVVADEEICPCTKTISSEEFRRKRAALMKLLTVIDREAKAHVLFTRN